MLETYIFHEMLNVRSAHKMNVNHTHSEHDKCETYPIPVQKKKNHTCDQCTMILNNGKDVCVHKPAYIIYLQICPF